MEEWLITPRGSTWQAKGKGTRMKHDYGETEGVKPDAQMECGP
jgi:hypothetical protein